MEVLSKLLTFDNTSPNVVVVVFAWGMIQFIGNAGNEAARKKGKEFMTWGLVGLFVMVSVWGLVAVLGNTFGVGNVIPLLPQ